MKNKYMHLVGGLGAAALLYFFKKRSHTENTQDSMSPGETGEEQPFCYELEKPYEVNIKGDKVEFYWNGEYPCMAYRAGEEAASAIASKTSFSEITTALRSSLVKNFGSLVPSDPEVLYTAAYLIWQVHTSDSSKRTKTARYAEIIKRLISGQLREDFIGDYNFITRRWYPR